MNGPLKPYQQVFCDDLYAPDVMLNAHREIKRTGGGGFLTEFGECEPDGRRNSSNTVLCETVLGLADKYMASWTYWDSDFYWENGTCRWDLVEAFVRPYPRAIAGTPISMYFEPERLVLFLEYEMDPSIKEPTEIFVPPLHYPNGIKVNAPGQPIRLEFDEINHILLIHPKSSVVEPVIVKLHLIPNF
jgi:endoglycosylceramidase